jgi:hypothetical protein
VVDGAALGDPLLDRVDLGLDEAPTASFSKRMSSGSSGTIIARGSLCDRAQPLHGERRLERRLLERARREAVADLLDHEAQLAEGLGEGVHGKRDPGEDEEIRLDSFV